MNQLVESRVEALNDLSFNVVLPVYSARNSFLPFMHALKIAYESRGELEIIDVRKNAEVLEKIGVRLLLENWGILKDGSQRSDVCEIGLRVKKIVKRGKKKEIIRRLDNNFHDILVIGSEKVSGLRKIFRKKNIENAALNFDNLILVVPEGAKGFVEYETGAVNVSKILITANGCYGSVCNLIKNLKAIFPVLEPELLNMAASDTETNGINIDGLRCRNIKKGNNIRSSILKSAQKERPDLVVIGYKNNDCKDKRKKILYVLHTIEKISCPVFILPSN